MKILLTLFLTLTTILIACDTDDSVVNNENEVVISTEEMANVISVTSTGMENNYTFSVGISSPDTGCSQYANWWEIIREDGSLIYRRILGHSHVNEQPFVRSGGTVNITANQVVLVRAHMNNFGYGTNVFKGSVSEGFIAFELEADFAQDLANSAPQPSDCAF